MSRTRVGLVLVAALGLALTSCLHTSTLTVVDLSLLQGLWEGTHEYLDYQGNAERIELPTTLVVTMRGAEAAGPAEAVFVFSYREPTGATTTDEATLRYFPSELLVDYRGNWAITEAAFDAGTASLLLVFSGKAKDDDRDALIRQTVAREGDRLIFRKEVRYDGSDAFITRGEHRLVLVSE